uniref:Uncharacterized protein n=2 Tax=Cacopsylla melanoneura TaxID=428564 RepID=A0A8D8W710_9HEMI
MECDSGKTLCKLKESYDEEMDKFFEYEEYLSGLNVKKLKLWSEEDMEHWKCVSEKIASRLKCCEKRRNMLVEYLTELKHDWLNSDFPYVKWMDAMILDEDYILYGEVEKLLMIIKLEIVMREE